MVRQKALAGKYETEFRRRAAARANGREYQREVLAERGKAVFLLAISE
jgi:hypothetical protein